MDPIRVCILRVDMRQYTGAINAPETTDCFWKYWADLARERERQWTTARANQTTGLTNSRATNWAPEVEFSRFRPLSRRQMTFAVCC